MRDKLIKWFIFSVLVALLPLLFNFLGVASRGDLPTLTDLCSRGELLLISAAIAAAAIGELIASGGSNKTAKVLAGGGAAILLSLNSLWFADISTAYLAGSHITAEVVSIGSIIMFAFTIISGASCIALSEV